MSADPQRPRVDASLLRWQEQRHEQRAAERTADAPIPPKRLIWAPLRYGTPVRIKPEVFGREIDPETGQHVMIDGCPGAGLFDSNMGMVVDPHDRNWPMGAMAVRVSIRGIPCLLHVPPEHYNHFIEVVE